MVNFAAVDVVCEVVNVGQIIHHKASCCAAEAVSASAAAVVVVVAVAGCWLQHRRPISGFTLVAETTHILQYALERLAVECKCV